MAVNYNIMMYTIAVLITALLMFAVGWIAAKFYHRQKYRRTALNLSIIERRLRVKAAADIVAAVAAARAEWEQANGDGYWDGNN